MNQRPARGQTEEMAFGVSFLDIYKMSLTEIKWVK